MELGFGSRPQGQSKLGTLGFTEARPLSAQQWHPLARSVLFSTQVAVARPQALPPSPLTELQALARSTLESLLVSVSKTFIFSTRHVRAVSVASPTFS